MTKTKKEEAIVLPPSSNELWEKQTEPIRTRADLILKAALEIKVRDHESYQRAADSLIDVEEEQRKYVEEKDKAVKPLTAVAKLITGWFSPSVKKLDEAKDHLKAELRGYVVKCEGDREKQIQKAREVNKVDPNKARELQERAKDALAPTVHGVSFSGKFAFEVTDFDAVPATFKKWVIDEDKLDAAVQAAGLSTSDPKSPNYVPGLIVTDARSVRVTPGARK